MDEPTDAIIQMLDEWWNRWHRVAEEDEKPPHHITKVLDWVEQTTGEYLDTNRGAWKKSTRFV